jgi:hypothetical protein
VPQVGHRPLMALRPFFMISSTASEIGFLALHLTQYPSAIASFGVAHPCTMHGNNTGRLGAADPQRQMQSVRLGTPIHCHILL